MTSISTTIAASGTLDEECLTEFTHQVEHHANQENHDKCLEWADNDDHHCQCDKATACVKVLKEVFPVWTILELSCENPQKSDMTRRLHHHEEPESGPEDSLTTYNHYHKFMSTCVEHGNLDMHDDHIIHNADPDLDEECLSSFKTQVVKNEKNHADCFMWEKKKSNCVNEKAQACANVLADEEVKNLITCDKVPVSSKTRGRRLGKNNENNKNDKNDTPRAIYTHYQEFSETCPTPQS